MTNDERGDGRDFNEAEAIFLLATAYVKSQERGDGPEGEGGENGGEQ